MFIVVLCGGTCSIAATSSEGASPAAA